MDMKNKTFGLVLIFLAIIILLSFSLFKCIKENSALKGALPYLVVGEKIGSIDLINVVEPAVTRKDLAASRFSLIFIIPRSSCIACDKNIVYWKKCAELFSDNISIYGIVLTNLTEAANSSQDAKVNFPLFVPENLAAFASKFRIKYNYAQTMIFKGTGLEYLQFGDLDGETAVKLLKVLKNLK